MQDNLQNRQGAPTKRIIGRPANSPTPLPVEAPPIMLPDTILPHICPLCGRGQTPTIVRKQPNSDRYVRCNSCGKEYVYRPASTRIKC